MVDMTGAEQLMLELMNRARADPIAEVRQIGLDLNQGLPSGTLSPVPKPPLAPNAALLQAARAHSRWMLATDTFSHSGPNGSSAADRIRAAGYQFGGSWAAGENISVYSTTARSLDRTDAIRRQHRSLLESPGHRKNIMNETFREAGIGQEIGRYTAQGRTWLSSMVTQNFARTGQSFYITGVVYRDRDGDRFYSPGEGLSGVLVQTQGARTYTFNSGGYKLAVGNGHYSVRFSGGGLPYTAQRPATVRGANVKVDVILWR